MRSALLLSLLLSQLLSQPAESQLEESLSVLGADLGIISDSEWRILNESTPEIIDSGPTLAAPDQIVLRRIVVKPLSGESMEDLQTRSATLADDLKASPEDFINRAKELNPTRQSLLSPMTFNQLDKEVVKSISDLRIGEVSAPIKTGESYEIFLVVSR